MLITSLPAALQVSKCMHAMMLCSLLADTEDMIGEHRKKPCNYTPACNPLQPCKSFSACALH